MINASKISHRRWRSAKTGREVNVVPAMMIQLPMHEAKLPGRIAH
jgi:hypothetical protein